MRARARRSSRLGDDLKGSIRVFLPIAIRDTLGNPVVDKTFWIDRKRVAGGSKIDEYSGKYTTDTNGQILNSFDWDGDPTVTGMISITPLFSYADGEANKAIVWQYPVAWHGTAPLPALVVALKPGGGLLDRSEPAPAPPEAVPSAPSSSGSGSSVKSSEEEMDVWNYVGLGILGLGALAITYFYALPLIFGDEE